jgi:hypothetical protein
VSGALTLSTAALIHFFVSLAALTLAILTLRNVPGSRMYASVGIALALTLAVILPLLAVTAGRSITAVNLTYFAVEDLLGATNAASPLREAGSLTPLHIWIYGPTLLGIVSVAMMAAAAFAQLSMLDAKQIHSEAEKEALICLVYKHIKACAYMLSLVLVTSATTASLYFHLPLRALGPLNEAGELSEQRLQAFADQLSLFWGGVFTLTLIAAIGIPLLLVQGRLRDFLDSLKPPELAVQTRDRLSKVGFLYDGREQAKLIFSFMAPLATGPLASLMQSTLA